MGELSFKFSEEDCMKMILEFLENRDLNLSQLSLERETGGLWLCDTFSILTSNLVINSLIVHLIKHVLNRCNKRQFLR